MAVGEGGSARGVVVVGTAAVGVTFASVVAVAVAVEKIGAGLTVVGEAAGSPSFCPPPQPLTTSSVVMVNTASNTRYRPS